MRFLYKILLLPILTTLLVIIMIDIQLIPALLLLNILELLKALGSDPFWSWDGWSAIEACGTILAVVVALWASHRALTREGRREDARRKFLRLSLRHEVEANLDEFVLLNEQCSTGYTLIEEALNRHCDRDERWRDASYDPIPTLSIPERRDTTWKRIEGHFELYSMAFTTLEAKLIDDFYDSLADQKKLISTYDTYRTTESTINAVHDDFNAMAANVERVQASGEQLLSSLKRPYASE